MKRRTFLKALGLGSALLPIITKAATKPELFKGIMVIDDPYKEIANNIKSTKIKDVEIFINDEKIIPFDNSVKWGTNLDDHIHTGPPQHINCRCTTKPLVKGDWSNKTPDEILSDMNDMFDKIAAATDVPVNRLKGS